MGNGLGIAWQWSAVLGCTAHSDASSRSVKGSRAPSNQRSIAAENPVPARLVLFVLAALIADVVTVAIEFGPILRGQWF